MNDLKQAVIEKSQEKNGKKKLPCSIAFEIASEFDVKPSEISKICNNEKFKSANANSDAFN